MSTVLDAAYQLVRAYPGGALSLAPRMGKNATSLSHEVKCTGTAKFGLDDAVNASVLTGDLRILNAFASECDCIVLKLPKSLESDSNAMMRVADLAREFGELVVSVTKATADGSITANELTHAQREWSELVAAGQSLLSHLEAKHAAGVPGVRS